MVQDISPTASADSRIKSLDQFRGFTVLAMFFVNFLHGMEAVPRVFQHNENWFSLADWIMPGFLFAVGMSFRLTWNKRSEKLGKAAAVRGYVRRSIILIGVSLIAFGFGTEFPSWNNWSGAALREFLAALIKARMWEVLAIIGASQLLMLPIIGTGTRVRMAALAVLLLLHAGLSQWFNVHFVLAKPNVLDAIWGAASVRAWDGGFFGLLGWSAIMLAGTVAYDWLAELSTTAAARRFLTIGACGLVAGYALSCLSTLYDVGDTKSDEFPKIAASPVITSGAPGQLALTEIPFTPIPPPESRQVNYWMMSKRLVTIPFVAFASGFIFVMLALFVFGCDRKNLEFSVLRLLGGNALAAFLLHYVVIKSLEPLVARDSPLWFVLLGLTLFLAISIAIMRVLEQKKLYLRL